MTDEHTTLLLGGRIYTPAGPDATAMAVTGGTVVWVGQDAPARALHENAEIVDLHGAFVAPAFVDAHVHATATGLHLTGLDLTGVRGAADLLTRVRDAVSPGQALLAHGWDETTWTDPRLPSRTELDAAAGGAPVYLSRVDVHSALVSTALVELAPAARAADGWSPDGPLTRAAHHAVRAAVRAAITPEQRERAQRAFLAEAAKQGIVSVHECAGPDISGRDDLAALLTLTGPDTPEVVGYWGELGAVETARELGARGLAGDLFVDGALGSHTAALTRPYADHPGAGTLYLDAHRIAGHLTACTEAGLQAGFHVIGDAAAAEVVEGFRLAEKEVGQRALAARHHRLEHLEMVTAEQAKQLAGWGVVASVQPLFDALWGGPEGMYAERLGADRAAGLNPFSALAAEGVLLSFGSDAPVTPLDPWASVRAAAYHRTPGAGLSPRAAFTAHTRAGHRAAGVNDGVTGSLVPGAPAHYAIWDATDLVVATPDSRVQRWSTDPRAGVPPLPRLEPDATLPRCLRTVRAGAVLHDAIT
ncbi:amidohydrolase [Amycolatopsis mediterranei]|uniref:amidohydrolase n=1 Tax=Amycolatopsis mediterranei TaxID=33910 RepID=UPI00049F8E39|nr:amidohydrolase [Amycolatopsis mediterranei]KDO06407.1 amidohydrolase [Amycolatopsis mediterranei]UZF71643.1 amidohydrolase [Amycolatopsis mediterranei]